MVLSSLRQSETEHGDLGSFRSEQMVLGVLGEPEYFSDDDEILTSVGDREEVRPARPSVMWM